MVLKIYILNIFKDEPKSTFFDEIEEAIKYLNELKGIKEVKA